VLPAGANEPVQVEAQKQPTKSLPKDYPAGKDLR
jgi:hypothetical protein